MKIYLVRHGESKSNYDNKYGEPYFVVNNVPLTEQGTESAQALVIILRIKTLIMYTFQAY